MKNRRRADPAVKRLKHRKMPMIAGRFVTVLMGGVLLLGAMLWINDRMVVRSWHIDGDPMLSHAVDAALQSMSMKDLVDTDVDQLAQVWLQNMADMERVDVMRILPDKLNIRVYARVPVALWQDARGHLHLFDRQGEVYRLLGEKESPDLPLLRVSKEDLPAAHRLLKRLQQQKLVAWSSLSEVRSGEQYWQLYFSKGASWMLPFGKEDQVMKQVVTLLKQPRWRDRQWKVDARLSSRWFIRPARHGGVI